MTPRYQKILLWLLLVSSVLMAAYLIRMRARAQDKLAAVPNVAPLPAPVEAPLVPATLMIANDQDGSLVPVERQLALPADPTTRARALLNDLFANYAQPGSLHPLAAFPAVNDVFLLPEADQPAASATAKPADAKEIAVVNLNGAFVDHHPSGILVETLTLLSILGTLHANLPQVAQVRFLVDGHQKETLAGHADLTRTYLAATDVPQIATQDAAPAPNGVPSRPSSANSTP